MSKKTLKPIAAALGTTFVVSLAASPIIVQAAENPFALNDLSSGYMVAEEGKCGEEKKVEGKAEGEGKCGEGKCGEGKAEGEGKCGEGKAEGEGKVEGEGKCGEGKAEGEGKCGEGKVEGEGKAEGGGK